MHGIMLERLGHSVHILEKDPSSIRTSEAAGIRAGPQAQEFFQDFDLVDQPWSNSCPGLKFINHDGSTQRVAAFTMVMTSWSILYYRLRANFDGFAISYCLTPPAALGGDGEAVYDCGKKATALEYTDGKVTVGYESVVDKTKHEVTPDLVIAADGSSSRLGVLFAMSSVLLKDMSPIEAV